MRYASVCDGIGAAHVAWKPLGWECAWTSEIEAFPAAVVEQRHGHRNLGDMTKLTEEQLDGCGPVSLLVGGTPCQSFSVAGLRKGLADPRGNLALRFVQLVGVLRPTWVVWENVPGVLSSAGGRDFGTFLGALGELGYGFAYRVLDAQWFGVAQRRRRVFVVAHARDWRRAAAVLFERESLFGDPPTRGEAGQGTAGGPADGFDAGGRLTAFHPTQDPISSEDGSVHALGTGSSGGCASAAVAFHENSRNELRTSDTAWAVTSGGGKPGQSYPAVMTPIGTDLYNGAIDGDVAHSVRVGNGNAMGGVPSAMVPPAVGIDFQNVADTGDVSGTLMGEAQKKGGEAGRGVAVAFAQNQLGEVRTNTSVMGTVNTNQNASGRNTPMVMTPMAVRRLTPMECERLQGFPDHYTAITYRNKPAADGPRYKALGNSMAVPVMAWIGRRIAEVEVLP